jgi:hypothetical protein
MWLTQSCNYMYEDRQLCQDKSFTLDIVFEKNKFFFQLIFNALTRICLKNKKYYDHGLENN